MVNKAYHKRSGGWWKLKYNGSHGASSRGRRGGLVGIVSCRGDQWTARHALLNRVAIDNGVMTQLLLLLLLLLLLWDAGTDLSVTTGAINLVDQ